MKFQKGMPRPEGAGRKKGTPNKKKFKKAAEVLAEAGLNPVEEILQILADDADKEEKDQMYPAQKVDIWMQLLSYCQAKPKETEAGDDDDDDGDDDDPLDELSDDQMLRLIKSDEAV